MEFRRVLFRSSSPSQLSSAPCLAANVLSEGLAAAIVWRAGWSGVRNEANLGFGGWGEYGGGGGGGGPGGGGGCGGGGGGGGEGTHSPGLLFCARVDWGPVAKRTQFPGFPFRENRLRRSPRRVGAAGGEPGGVPVPQGG